MVYSWRKIDSQIINSQPASDRERAALTGSEITPEMRPREWSAEVVKGKAISYVLTFDGS